MANEWAITILRNWLAKRREPIFVSVVVFSDGQQSCYIMKGREHREIFEGENRMRKLGCPQYRINIYPKRSGADVVEKA